MKEETEKKILDWIANHPPHENLRKKMASELGLGISTIVVYTELLIAKGKIKVAQKFGNATAYQVVETKDDLVRLVDEKTESPD